VTDVAMPRRAIPAVAGVVPTALAIAAEAAWVAVLAAMLQAFTRTPATTGYPWFLLAAVAGLVATRVLETRAGERWPVLVAALAVATGAVGWLLSPEVRTILVEQGLGGVGEAVAANIGGWLGALAFVRGVAHARLPADPHRIGNLLGLAIPGLAAIAILGGVVGEPFRSAFLAEAQAEVLVFLVCGITALALARVNLVATGAAVDWRRNPAWLALLVVLLAATAALALVVALFGGQVIVMGLGALLTPLLIVGFFVGFDRRSFTILMLSIVGTAAVATLIQLFASSNASPAPVVPGGAPTLPPDPAATVPVTIGVLGVIIAVAVIAVLVLARLWLRRPRDEDPDVPETREIDRGDWELDGSRRRRRVLPGRRRAPHDAVTAYRALLEDLEAHPTVRRQDGETPAEHAARLRAEGHGALALDLLAADYGLARFGERDLTPSEHRRAVGRARTLRRRLPSS
jgi:hypothetical protein